MEQNINQQGSEQQQPSGVQNQPALLERVIGILTKPKEEWKKIELETPDQNKILTSYVLILALIPAIANFIGYGFIGIGNYWGRVRAIDLGLGMAISSYITSIVGVFLSSLVINELAPNFDTQKNYKRSFQLVAYSMTASWVAGVLFIVPSLSTIVMLAGLYSLVLLYIGFDYTMKPPKDKKTGYFIVSLLVMIIINIFVGFILNISIGNIYMHSLY